MTIYYIQYIYVYILQALPESRMMAYPLLLQHGISKFASVGRVLHSVSKSFFSTQRYYRFFVRILGTMHP